MENTLKIKVFRKSILFCKYLRNESLDLYEIFELRLIFFLLRNPVLLLRLNDQLLNISFRFFFFEVLKFRDKSLIV